MSPPPESESRGRDGDEVFMFLPVPGLLGGRSECSTAVHPRWRYTVWLTAALAVRGGPHQP
jgi:hypothetical protein